MNDYLKLFLISAVEDENLEEVKSLLSTDANVNLQSLTGYSLLHKTKNIEIIRELLQRGVYVNEVHKQWQTSLHTAIKEGHGVEKVRELLKHGAYQNNIDGRCNSALNLAVKKENTDLELVKELLKYGGDGESTSGIAFLKHKIEVIKLFVKFSLIINFNKYYELLTGSTRYRMYCKYTGLSGYADDCVSEVFQMKADKIKNSLSLYEFVAEKSNRFGVCNHELARRLKKKDYYVRYPIYSDYILEKVHPFSERIDLLNKLYKVKLYTKSNIENEDVEKGKISLDYDSVCSIAEYLTNAELRNFIEAFNDSQKQKSPIIDMVKPGASLCEPSTSNDAKRKKFE